MWTMVGAVESGKVVVQAASCPLEVVLVFTQYLIGSS